MSLLRSRETPSVARQASLESLGAMVTRAALKGAHKKRGGALSSPASFVRVRQARARLAAIEAVERHDFRPGFDEVFDKGMLCAFERIDFGDGAQFRV